ncbi:MAG TPA: glycosyltransferase [Solirubrobacteraceae bacterium]|nr:glycosyltransferase [Solirubrobacteraceae bacterium]
MSGGARLAAGDGDREGIDVVDVLLVQLGSTEGLRVADEQLVGSLRRAGARVVVASAAHPGEVRTLMLTDLLWARAARRAAVQALARLRKHPPRAVIYSTTTAALLWPRPGAIRFDAPAAANRVGRHGLWQRPLERRRLRQAPLLLPSSAGALAEAAVAVPGCEQHALVVPSPIADFTAGEGRLAPAAVTAGEEGIASGVRDLAALTYAANPHKKGLDRVLAAWRAVHRPGERLAIVGITPERLRQLGFTADDDSIEALGTLPQHDYHALLHRARVFVCAPRREDYGLVQLEALAAGCQLVTTAAPGPYVALPIARRLDPRLVGGDLGVALRAALDAPGDDYPMRAAALVEPFTVAAVDRLVANELLPRLVRDEHC